MWVVVCCRSLACSCRGAPLSSSNLRVGQCCQTGGGTVCEWVRRKRMQRAGIAAASAELALLTSAQGFSFAWNPVRHAATARPR